MEFDPYEVLGYVKALSFPRRTGSTGEAQTQEYIINRFKALGLEPREEEFSFTPILGLLSKGFLLIVLLSLTALHLLSPFYPLPGIILCLCILILTLGFLWGRPVVALLGWALFKELPLIRNLHSKNIMASWPIVDEFPVGRGVSQYAPTHIYILAHYDSKSQTLPIGGRIPLVMALFLSALSLSAYHLLIPLAGLHVLGTVERTIFIMALTSGLVLLWTKTRNLSPGAVDNASGVALMLHLAEAISRDVQGFKGLRFHFVATGAEEEGLVGAFWLRKSVEGDPTGRPYYFINLDGVGTKGRVYCTDKIGLHPYSQGQKEFLALIRKAAEAVGARCNVPLQVYSPPITMGAMADHFPFTANGYRAVTFSTVSRRSLWVHTPWDTLEMVEVEGMEVVGRLILGVLRLLK
ncbi:MAG TPA: M28 family metallopeptidase [Candidatus Tripitaka californicus]|uniref:M28 family metallopeptidase n=1 Tax=Candidatus Tripitaka californicus TaxID=3367616 RepID=UPI0040274077